MQTSSLKIESFAAYLPEARQLMVAHLAALQQLPLSFVPNLLREAIDYDFKFPAERTAIRTELAQLSALTPQQLQAEFQAFAQISVSPVLENFDWVNHPAQFVEQQSAYLWSTHQLDAFRKAATVYGDQLRSATPALPLPARRLGIAVIGQGVAAYDAPLFRNLRPHGTLFQNVQPDGGLQTLLGALAERAQASPAPYAHWYVDGGREAPCHPSLTCVSYNRLAPVRAALLKNIDTEIARPGMGPEDLRSHLARLSVADLALPAAADLALSDPTLARFQIKLFTEGSGTQIFSTTFAQWTTREALRRAQPLTLLVRYAPRQRQRPMNEMLTDTSGHDDLDPTGSLVDADMASYYHWINQQRLPESERSAFLVWFEGHSQALVIGPSMARGTISNSKLDMQRLLNLALA